MTQQLDDAYYESVNSLIIEIKGSDFASDLKRMTANVVADLMRVKLPMPEFVVPAAWPTLEYVGEVWQYKIKVMDYQTSIQMHPATDRLPLVRFNLPAGHNTYHVCHYIKRRWDQGHRRGNFQAQLR